MQVHQHLHHQPGGVQRAPAGGRRPHRHHRQPDRVLRAGRHRLQVQVLSPDAVLHRAHAHHLRHQHRQADM